MSNSWRILTRLSRTTRSILILIIRILISTLDRLAKICRRDSFHGTRGQSRILPDLEVLTLLQIRCRLFVCRSVFLCDILPNAVNYFCRKLLLMSKSASIRTHVIWSLSVRIRHRSWRWLRFFGAWSWPRVFALAIGHMMYFTTVAAALLSILTLRYVCWKDVTAPFLNHLVGVLVLRCHPIFLCIGVWLDHVLLSHALVGGRELVAVEIVWIGAWILLFLAESTAWAHWLLLVKVLLWWERVLSLR